MMVMGVVGGFVPVLPGGVLIFAGILFYAWATAFRLVDGWWILVFLLLTLASYLMDYVATVWGARRYGASKAGAIGALLGGIVGFFTLGVVGVFIGPFLGAVLGELVGGQSLIQAGRAGWGTVIGLLISIFLQFVIHISMVGLFLMLVF